MLRIIPGWSLPAAGQKAGRTSLLGTKKSPGEHAPPGKDRPKTVRDCAEDLGPRVRQYTPVTAREQAPSKIPAFIRDATRSLSTERLHEYRRNAGDPALTRLGYYAWNIALCEALYPALHLCEVALRNSLHETLRREYPVRAKGERVTSWLDAGTRVLTPEHAERVDKAKRKLQARLRGHRIPFTPGRLIAEMSFGFWTYLFDSEYGYVSSRSPGLWPRLLDSVFPNLPDQSVCPRQREFFATRLGDILRLRNRAFHHEPLWKRPDLKAEHGKVVETIGWLNPAAARTLAEFDRFPWVWEEVTGRFLRAKVREVAAR